jgi:hypothetical protein
MAKKCPPGVFCIENITLSFILFFILIVGFVMYTILTNNNKTKNKIKKRVKFNEDDNIYYVNPTEVLSNQRENIFLNPYSPPLKQNRFYPNHYHDIRKFPVNMSTSHYNFEYSQVGILTSSSGKERILPLFGRPLHKNRNKWQYYTMTDKNNFIKLPLSFKGKHCTGDYGCDELFNNDSVYVQGYNEAFNVTIYENNNPTYIPYL